MVVFIFTFLVSVQYDDERAWRFRACFKIAWGPAARDFGRGQDGEDRASPQRAVRSEPTQATDKRPAARRVFAEKAGWLRCFSVTAPLRGCSLVAPRHPAFSAKTGLPRNFKQALKRLRSLESRPGQVLTSATPIQANPRALPILTECLGICLRRLFILQNRTLPEGPPW